MAIVECVPNFSEGRRPEILDQICEAIAAVPGVDLLGREMDADHNRSVVTIAGEPEAVLLGAFEGCKKASELIDLREHSGQHKRMGATDVIPFIPVQGIDMKGCVKLATRLAKKVGKELSIPTYLYAEAAQVDGRRKLAKVRKGEFEKLRELIGTDESRTPDHGPNNIHETAGATAVGARFFLIAYNINLESQDLALAKEIAVAVREKDGGLPGVQGMGFELESEGCVQVSMNLLDYRKTSPAQVYLKVQELAAAKGVAIRESELIGLVPQECMDLCMGQVLKVKDFDPVGQVIEQKMSGKGQYYYMKDVGNFLSDLASKNPTPGGGAAAAVLGATGIALGEMVGNLTKGKKKFKDVKDIVIEHMNYLTPARGPMLNMFAEDAEAFNEYMDAMALPKDSDDEKKARAAAMQEAAKNATLSPDKTAELGIEAFKHLYEIAMVGNPHAISDCGVGALALYASVRAAAQNMHINLPSIKDEDFRAKYSARANQFDKEAQELLDKTLAVVHKAING
ncbi:glutamate formimidoyltransferase [Planctomycetota bacterium]|nr:glutamate formimidoyltransferase [Planctomycetota bacterium]